MRTFKKNGRGELSDLVAPASIDFSVGCSGKIYHFCLTLIAINSDTRLENVCD